MGPQRSPRPGSAGRRAPGRRAGPWTVIAASCLAATLLQGSPRPARALPTSVDRLEEAREMLLAGRYRECAEAAAKGIEDGLPGEAWHALRLDAHLAVGAIDEAIVAFEAAMLEFPVSVAIRWHGRVAFLRAGKSQRARLIVEEIESLLRRSPSRYQYPEDRVIVGRFLLHRGADARAVLEQVYDPLKRSHPDLLGPWLASGDLALEKQDLSVAAQEFRKALALDPDHPEVLLGLARALEQSAPDEAQTHLRAALERNPNHVGSLLELVDSAVDRERYDEASALVDRILAVDPGRELAFAYRAVLAHLRGDWGGEKAARDAALSKWAANPAVDHLIGRKLSQKYRFAEGAAYQRRALKLEPGNVPARLQLCQDLLRLGQDEEGWKLAGEVYQADGYSVVAHNLELLRQRLKGYAVLERSGIRLRMDPKEAAVYGEPALDLLVRARDALAAKYRVQIPGPIAVELFAEQQDFAIRTFGLPGGAGFLGVCFGSVITANSPASQGETPANWQSVLWHEMGHVVTLHKSGNRMPRWLSEGISVHEEGEADRTWGQAMNPRYLEIIDKEGPIPLSRLSAAFLEPASPEHLELAYYQSSLAVACIIERGGMASLEAILSDLARGLPIDDALARRAGPLDELERAVDAYIRARAGELAAKADWTPPEVAADSGLEEIAAWNRAHPRSFRGLHREATLLIAEKRWDEARDRLERLIALSPEQVSPGNAYELLSVVHREAGRPAEEARALRSLAERDSNPIQACLRLLELCEASGDRAGEAWAAERLLAINPLLKAPHRALARVAAELGQPARATGSLRALLAMDPTDPADLHLELARALRAGGKLAEARREVLEAIVEAPRFRDAHRELLALLEELRTAEAADPGGAAPATRSAGGTP